MLVHFARRVEDDALRELFVIDPADALEDVAERPVAQVVQQRAQQADGLVFLGDRRTTGGAGRGSCRAVSITPRLWL